MTTFYFLLVQEEDLAREEDLLLVQEENHICPYRCLLVLIGAYYCLLGLIWPAYWCLFRLHMGAYWCLRAMKKTFAMPKELPMIGNNTRVYPLLAMPYCPGPALGKDE